MLARPDETASKDSNAPTSWPAAYTLTLSRPPESVVIASATRSAPDCRPGKLFGQVVTILSSRAPCETAGMGNEDAAAATPIPAPATNLRRSMFPSRLAIRFVPVCVQQSSYSSASPRERRHLLGGCPPSAAKTKRFWYHQQE